MADMPYEGNGKEVWLYYPRTHDDPEMKQVTIGLCDVRAADDIQISYDFDRDGYVIKQASIFSWSGDDPVCDPDYQEVAFIQAWQRKTDEDD